MKSENIKVVSKDKKTCAMFHDLPSLFAAFSLFLIKVWTKATPRDRPQAGWEVNGVQASPSLLPCLLPPTSTMPPTL